MSKEDLKQAVATLLEIVSGGPTEDLHEVEAELRAKIAQMRAAGIPVPADLLQYEDGLPDDGAAEDTFENMPV